MSFRIQIGDRTWRVHRARRPGNTREWGNLIPKTGTIYLHPDLTGFELVDTAIHEGLHAILPDVEEDFINKYATQLARLLRRLDCIKED